MLTTDTHQRTMDWLERFTNLDWGAVVQRVLTSGGQP
jgi:hypothetical protein